jgi:hypothetical protein
MKRTMRKGTIRRRESKVHDQGDSKESWGYRSNNRALSRATHLAAPNRSVLKGTLIRQATETRAFTKTILTSRQANWNKRIDQMKDKQTK